jgi:hypothetical protein
MGALKKSLYVFFSPTRAFERINARPNWLLPLLLVLAVTIAYQLLVVSVRIGDTKDAVRNNPNLSTEQIDMALENIEKMTEGPELNKRVRISLGIFTVSEIVKLFVAAGVFMLAVQIGLGESSFKKILAVTSHVNLVAALGMIVKLPLILTKKTLNIYTSLAVFLPVDYSNSFIHRLLNGFDIFAFWRIGLFSLGLAAVTELSLKKSTLLVIYVWTGWIIVFALFGNLVRIN